MKQETLEEVINNFKKTDVYINGIKQEHKTMYSEGDMIIAMGFASSIDNNMDVEDKLKLCIDFIQQFKNK